MLADFDDFHRVGAARLAERFAGHHIGGDVDLVSCADIAEPAVVDGRSVLERFAAGARTLDSVIGRYADRQK